MYSFFPSIIFVISIYAIPSLLKLKWVNGTFSKSNVSRSGDFDALMEIQRLRNRMIGAFLSCLISYFWCYYIIKQYCESKHEIDVIGCEHVNMDWFQQSKWSIFGGFSTVSDSFTEYLIKMIKTISIILSLFMGPIYVDFIDRFGQAQTTQDRRSSLENRLDTMLFVRNIAVAPIVEEWTYRVCVLLPWRISGISPELMVFASPVYFGAAHLHHFIQRYKESEPLIQALITTIVQFVYTTVFGWISTYIYICTGSWVCSVLAHALCNWFGLPDFSVLAASNYRYKMKPSGLMRFFHQVAAVRLVYFSGLLFFGYFLSQLPTNNGIIITTDR